MAMFLSRPGPSSPRLVVVKADPSLATDPENFAREYLEISGDAHPLLDAAEVSSSVSLLGTDELNDRPEFADSEFAQVFLPRYELEYAMALHLKIGADQPDAGVAMFRTAGEHDFTDREKGFLRHSGAVLAHSFRCALEAESAIPERTGHLAMLTAREHEIARLAALGSKNDEIAEKLQISPGTVKTHLRNIYSKLEVDSRVHLAMRLAGH